MDNSTAGVTLNSGFVFDVLREYEDSRKVLGPLFEKARGLDPNAPDAVCSIEIYNDVCNWIEANVGESSIRGAGRAVAERIYSNISAGGKESKTPDEVVGALKWAADNMIQDPKKRGWVIVESKDQRIVMRRTQTFNCMLQEGLLMRLVELTGVTMPSVKHERCTRRKDQYCEYTITWLKGAAKR